MKKESIFLAAITGILFISFFLTSCTKGAKCKEKTYTSKQTTTHVDKLNLGQNHATVNDANITYLFSYAFFEVCTYSSISLESSIFMDGIIPVSAEIRMYDVYERPIFDWTPMEFMIPNTLNFWFSDQEIYATPKEQENIVWVEVRIRVSNGYGFTPDEMHEYIAENLGGIHVNLIYHKPNYE